MVVGGVSMTQENGDLLDLALRMLDSTRDVSTNIGFEINIRIGINTGFAIGGIIGDIKPFYDFWGEAVNHASRMESTGVPGKIQVSEASRIRYSDRYEFERRIPQAMIDGREQETFWLIGKKISCPNSNKHIVR